MKSLYIRGMDETLYLALSEQAEKMELSLPELARRVLANYAAAPALAAIDHKYRVFVDEVQEILALDFAKKLNRRTCAYAANITGYDAGADGGNTWQVM